MKKLISVGLSAISLLSAVASIPTLNSGTIAGSSVTASQIAANLPGSVVTNQYVYRLYIFQSGYGTNTSIYTNGVWAWQGQNPTNLVLTSRSPIFLDTNLVYNSKLRDPHVTFYGGQYIMSWSHYPFGTATSSDGPGVATSLDGYNFTFLGYANITNSFFPSGSKPCWSPYFFNDLTNGLKLLVSLGNTNSSTPTNYFIADVNYPNLLSLTNFRPIFATNDTDAATHWGGSEIICNGGTVYFFTQTGNEYTNSDLVSTGWKWAYPTNYVAVGGGQLPTSTSIVKYGGWYYLIGSSLSASGMQLEVSTNLINWIPNLDDPAEPGNTFIPHPAIGEASGDGTVVAIPMANSGNQGFGLTPQNYLAATGVSPFDGSGLTNITGSANALTNGFQNTITYTNFLLATTYTNTTTRSAFVSVNGQCSPTTTVTARFALATSPTGATFTTNAAVGLDADTIFTTVPHGWYQATAIVPPGGIWKVVDITGGGAVMITNSYWQTLQ